MNIYTVSFFGHRYLHDTSEIENRLDRLLHDLITQKEYVEFLIGRDGDFDRLASSAIRRAMRKFDCGNTAFTLILPYLKAEYRDNEDGYLDYYSGVEICEETAGAHPKAAIQLRNRSMVDRSDLVVCCIQQKSGGAYKTVQYAKKQNRRIINLADDTEPAVFLSY